MKAVKLLQDYEPYIAGDVVDLDDKLADKLIVEGLARSYRVVLSAATVETGDQT